MTYDEIDSLIDKHRELVRDEREALAEFARPVADVGGWCEICLMPIDYGNCCPRCDLWGDGLYDENRFTYDERVPDA